MFGCRQDRYYVLLRVLICIASKTKDLSSDQKQIGSKDGFQQCFELYLESNCQLLHSIVLCGYWYQVPGTGM